MLEVIRKFNEMLESKNSIILVKMYGDRPRFTLYENNNLNLETFDFNLLRDKVLIITVK